MLKADCAYTEFSAALCYLFDPAMTLLFAPTHFCFLFWCVHLDIVQTVGYRTVWNLCISQYIYSMWVCMAVLVIIFILSIIYIYLFFCMIDNKGRCKSVVKVKWSGMLIIVTSFCRAVFPVIHALWMCQKSCIFCRIPVFITNTHQRHAVFYLP